MITKEIVRQNITTWPELGINYWGINKNATSTFINHFQILTGNLLPHEVYQNDGQKGKISLRHRYIDYNSACSNGLKNFAILRNPFDRFESCYKQFKFPITETQNKSSQKARFDPTWTADDFLLYIESKLCNNPKAGNKHFWAQTTFLHNYNAIDFAVKLENLNQDWPFEFEAPLFTSNPSLQGQPIKYDKSILKRIYKKDFKTFEY